MPALNQKLMVLTAKDRFRSFRLKAPPGGAPAARGVGAPAVRVTVSKVGATAIAKATPLSMPPALFLASGTSAADVQSQRQHSDEFDAFIDKACAAICAAHEHWRSQAHFRDIRIMGPVAEGGRLEGPALEPLIKSELARIPGAASMQRHGQAIASALGGLWAQWCQSVRVPGLPWYPSFAAIPGASAPPTPNVPTPLAALSFPREAVSPNRSKDEMKRRLGAPAPFSDELFDAIATGFASAIDTWLPSQMVQNVMGRGPVPAHAPPYVPTGPVVMGDNIAVPGHLLT